MKRKITIIFAIILVSFRIMADNTQLVGTIDVNTTVSESGGAVITIPIDVPAGINGMQPNLALVYNSQGGLGTCGWGWNLSGLSSITRTGSTPYYDGDIRGIKFDTHDNLLLDGQRLILESGTNLTAGAVYRTEVESWSKITFNSKLTGLEVKSKNGIKAVYGDMLLSQIADAPTPGRNILAWNISKITDINGNFMTYTYTTSYYPGESHLTKIAYTGNSQSVPNLNPTKEVIFEYQDLPHSYTYYENGIAFSCKKILHRINVRSNNQELWHYELTYTTDSIHYKLSTVAKVAANGDSYAPVELTWSTEQPGSLNANTLNEPQGISSMPQECVYGDFNGDGKTDYFLYDTGSADCIFYINTTPPSGSASFIPYVRDFSGSIKTVKVCDFNGDGKDELIVCYTQGFLPTYYFVGSFAWNPSSYTYHSIRYGTNSKIKHFLTGDFDGNGKQEVIFLRDSLMYSYASGVSSSQFTGLSKWENAEGGAKSKAENSVPLDFNGDGKTDVFMIVDSRIYAYEYNDTSHAFTTICNMPVSGAGLNNNIYDEDNDKLQFGDFNGDGKTDIVCSQKHILYNNLYQWKAHVLLSDGRKLIPSSVEEGGENCYISDCNNDGFSDYFFCAKDSYTNKWYLNIGLNKGLGFEYSNQELQGIGGSALKPANVAFFDVYGDGRGEFLHYKMDASGNSATLLYLRIFTDHPFLLTKIKDGNGQESFFTYQPVCNPDIYTSSFSATENVLPLKSSLHVVSSFTAPYTSLQHTYSDGRIHRKGKGFMGFMEHTVTDNLNHTVAVQKNTMDDTYFFLKPSYATVSYGNNQMLSRTDITMQIKTYGTTKRFWPYVTRSISRDFLTTLADTTRNEYDDYGNLTCQSKTVGNKEAQSCYRYVTAGSAEYPNCVGHSMSRSRLGSEWSDSVWTDCKYDAKGRLVHQVEDSLSTIFGGTMLSSHYKYDSFGHVIRTVTKDSLQTRTSSVTYSAGNPYSPSTSTDILGMTTTYYNNNQTGWLDSIADGAGRKTRYQYDAFGRMERTYHPDGSESLTTLQRVTSTNGVAYSVSTSITNAPSLTTWYNASGMPVCEEKSGLYGDDRIFTVTKYAADGRVSCVSEPFYETSLANAMSKTFTSDDATLYTYDLYGRTSEIQSPVGTSYYTYNGLTTIVTTPEGTYQTTKNTSGLVTSKILDPNGTISPSRSISYEYHPTGQVKAITPQGSTAVRLWYDRRGRRTKLIDPDAGTIIDRYNAFGQLLSHRQDIHNGNVETTYSYGATTGRLESETTHGVNSRTKIYTYSSTFKNQPTKIAYSGSNYVAYSYDALGRMTQTQEVINGEAITDSYTYAPDDYGQLTSHSHNGLVTEYFTYDGYGNMVSSSLSPNGTPLWELTEIDASGRVLKEKKSGITTTYTYDKAGRVKSIVAPGIVDLNYWYDSKGNTTYKTDELNGLETAYSYDSKNRLTGWAIGEANQQSYYQSYTMSYDGTTGNILSKTDLGANAAFSYGHATKPHALTGITNYPDTCSLVTISYTDFGKVQYIARSGQAYSIDYLPNGARGKSVWTAGGRTITRYYGDGSEKVYDTYGAERDISFLSCGGFVIEDWILPSSSVDGRAGGSSDGDSLRASPPPPDPNPQPVSTSVLHGYYDAQGSLIALVNTNGTVVRRYAYDPWGKRVSPTDWTQADTRSDYHHINRGYTMHEHLDGFGLINMNGRVFDPATAQFLSPDNYIQEDGNWLNYNRYAYCLNNPLKFTDPSGDLAITATTLFIAGMSSGLINMGMHIDDSQNAGKYFAIGAISYLASGAIGAAAGFSIGSIVTNIGAGAVITGIAAGAVGGAAGGAAGGFILGYGNSRIGGVNFVKSLQNGVSSAERNATYNAVFDAVVGTISGLNNDVYCEVEIQETRDFSSEEIAMMKQRAITYHSSDISNNDSEYLQYRVQKVYHLSETENGIDISSITTKFDVGTYGLTTNGYYYKYANNTIVGGYIVHGKHPTIVHISPAVTYANDVHFKAVVGHELIHAYHNYSIPNFSTYFSERVAYQYSFREYLNNGNFQEANELKKMIRGAYPLYYYINPYFLHLY